MLEALASPTDKHYANENEWCSTEHKEYWNRAEHRPSCLKWTVFLLLSSFKGRCTRSRAHTERDKHKQSNPWLVFHLPTLFSLHMEYEYKYTIRHTVTCGISVGWLGVGVPFVLNPDVDTWAPSCLDKSPWALGTVTSSSGSWHPGTVEPLCPWPCAEQLSSSAFKCEARASSACWDTDGNT